MQTQIEISVKILGKKRPMLDNLPIQLPSDNATLSQLIEIIVHQQTADFNHKREEKNWLRYLSHSQAMKETGKMGFGQVYNTETVDVEKAVQDALQAFEDGLYFVFVDDKKIDKLDDNIDLKAHSKVFFLRLVALTGGYF
ncbi:MAG: hypothetical protein ABFS56_10345 [Pseudomonadota bacterium]